MFPITSNIKTLKNLVQSLSIVVNRQKIWTHQPGKLHDANVGQNTSDGNLVSFAHLITYHIVFLEAERGPLILTSKRAVTGCLSVVEEIDVQ